MIASETTLKRTGSPWWLWAAFMLVSLPPLALMIAAVVHRLLVPPYPDFPQCFDSIFDYVLFWLAPGGVLLLVVVAIAVCAQLGRVKWIKPALTAAACIGVAQVLVFVKPVYLGWDTWPTGEPTFCVAGSDQDLRFADAGVAAA